MSQKESSVLIGQIDLLALVQASIRNIDGQECIVIPKSFNPSINVSTTKSGIQKAYLNIVIKESPSNPFGNSHFIKAQIDKNARMQLALDKDDVAKYSPIIGNLYALTK